MLALITSFFGGMSGVGAKSPCGSRTFAATSIRRGPSIPSGRPIGGNISVPLLDLDTLSLFHAVLMLFQAITSGER